MSTMIFFTIRQRPYSVSFKVEGQVTDSACDVIDAVCARAFLEAWDGGQVLGFRERVEGVEASLDVIYPGSAAELAW